MKDFFEDADFTYLVTKTMKKTLQQEMQEMGGILQVNEVCSYLKRIVKCLIKLHKKCIVHRDLRLDAISIKKSKDKIKLQISQFNFSHMLKKNHTI